MLLNLHDAHYIRSVLVNYYKFKQLSSAELLISKNESVLQPKLELELEPEPQRRADGGTSTEHVPAEPTTEPTVAATTAANWLEPRFPRDADG